METSHAGGGLHMTGATASNEVVWHFEIGVKGLGCYMCEGSGLGVWRFRIWGLRVLDLAEVIRDRVSGFGLGNHGSNELS